MFLVPVLALCSRLSERETGEKEGGEGRKERGKAGEKDERRTQKEGSCCLWDSLKQEQGTKFCVGPVLGGVGSQKSRN